MAGSSLLSCHQNLAHLKHVVGSLPDSQVSSYDSIHTLLHAWRSRHPTSTHSLFCATPLHTHSVAKMSWKLNVCTPKTWIELCADVLNTACYISESMSVPPADRQASFVKNHTSNAWMFQSVIAESTLHFKWCTPSARQSSMCVRWLSHHLHLAPHYRKVLARVVVLCIIPQAAIQLLPYLNVTAVLAEDNIIHHPSKLPGLQARLGARHRSKHPSWHGTGG